MSTGLIAAASGSTADIVVAVAFYALYGLLGYFFAVMTRRAIGTTPWHLPAIAWGFVSALLPLFGLLIETVARFTTRRTIPPNHRPILGQAHRAGASAGPAAGTVPGAHWGESAGGTAWSPPVNPAGGDVPWPTETGYTRPGPDGWRSADATPPPLFGWYEDPDGEHETRYWDGRGWSDFVRDGSVNAVVPLRPIASLWQLPDPDAPAGETSDGPVPNTGEPEGSRA